MQTTLPCLKRISYIHVILMVLSSKIQIHSTYIICFNVCTYMCMYVYMCMWLPTQAREYVRFQLSWNYRLL